MANISKLREAFDKYDDCKSNKDSYEEELWGRIKEFVQEHGRFDFNFDEFDEFLYAFIITDDGNEECIVNCMYIKDNELLFDVTIKNVYDDAEYEGCSLSDIEFDDWGLPILMRQVEASCDNK